MTRYGAQTHEWLLKHGWEPVPIKAQVYGDPTVIDPKTGKEYTVYDAAKEHKKRTGEYPDFLKDTDD